MPGSHVVGEAAVRTIHSHGVRGCCRTTYVRPLSEHVCRIDMVPHGLSEAVQLVCSGHLPDVQPLTLSKEIRERRTQLNVGDEDGDCGRP